VAAALHCIVVLCRQVELKAEHAAAAPAADSKAQGNCNHVKIFFHSQPTGTMANATDAFAVLSDQELQLTLRYVFMYVVHVFQDAELASAACCSRLPTLLVRA
jgi:hypothetical protein